MDEYARGFACCEICGAVRWADEMVYKEDYDGYVCALADHPRTQPNT